MPSSPSSKAEPIKKPKAAVRDRGRLAQLVAYPYAHRGLHGRGPIENSRAAFAAAIARRHGIELDVQASRDGDAFVFHDYDLHRLTGESGAVRDRGSDELARIWLAGTEETIPTLPEILELIGGRVPLLIEVKSPNRRVGPLCQSVRAALEGYPGVAAVMSFNPQIGRWFARHAPDVVRGLVVTEENRRGLRGRIGRRLAFMRARPHFLAYDIRDLPSRFAAWARGRGLPILTWTVRTPRDGATAEVHASQIIYEIPPR